MSSPILTNLDFLQCPDCGSDILSNLYCSSCSRIYHFHENYLNLLPSKLAQNKINENFIFSEESDEYAKFKDRPWLKMIGRLEIERFCKEIVYSLPEGRFLELAGESCWATAIYKSIYPNSFAIASDVSENAIHKLAMPLGHMFSNQIDLYASIDAERLPIKDNSIDCIFIESAMHHLPNTVRMLKETKRVLRSGGVFIAVDHCVPKHLRFLFIETAKYRQDTYGIQEDLVSYEQWLSYFNNANIPVESVNIYTNPDYQRNPWFSIAGKLISKLPVSLARSLFPVGIYVKYKKA